MGTISAREPMAGYPFTNPFDISDGTSPEVSTGIPYMYFTDIEMSVIDINVSKQGHRKVLKFKGGGVVIQGPLKEKVLHLFDSKSGGGSATPPPVRRLWLCGRKWLSHRAEQAV